MSQIWRILCFGISFFTFVSSLATTSNSKTPYVILPLQAALRNLPINGKVLKKQSRNIVVHKLYLRRDKRSTRRDQENRKRKRAAVLSKNQSFKFQNIAIFRNSESSQALGIYKWCMVQENGIQSYAAQLLALKNRAAQNRFTSPHIDGQLASLYHQETYTRGRKPFPTLVM